MTATDQLHLNTAAGLLQIGEPLDAWHELECIAPANLVRTETLTIDTPHYQCRASVLQITAPKMKLRIYAIFVTVVLVAVLTNPSAEQHYAKLAQFYPWVNESRLADARMEVWSLSPPSEREKWLPYDSLTNDGYDLFLIYTS